MMKSFLNRRIKVHEAGFEGARKFRSEARAKRRLIVDERDMARTNAFIKRKKLSSQSEYNYKARIERAKEAAEVQNKEASWEKNRAKRLKEKKRKLLEENQPESKK